MTDLAIVAAELEAEALANGWPRNHRALELTTTQGSAAMAVVTVQLVDPGITENPDTYNVTNDGAQKVLAVLTNDVDLASGGSATLKVGSVVSPTALGGTAVINPSSAVVSGVSWLANQTIIYTPPAGVFGVADSFSYTAVRA